MWNIHVDGHSASIPWLGWDPMIMSHFKMTCNDIFSCFLGVRAWHCMEVLFQNSSSVFCDKIKLEPRIEFERQTIHCCWVALVFLSRSCQHTVLWYFGTSSQIIIWHILNCSKRSCDRLWEVKDFTSQRLSHTVRCMKHANVWWGRKEQDVPTKEYGTRSVPRFRSNPSSPSLILVTTPHPPGHDRICQDRIWVRCTHIQFGWEFSSKTVSFK